MVVACLVVFVHCTIKDDQVDASEKKVEQQTSEEITDESQLPAKSIPNVVKRTKAEYELEAKRKANGVGLSGSAMFVNVMMKFDSFALLILDLVNTVDC